MCRPSSSVDQNQEKVYGWQTRLGKNRVRWSLMQATQPMFSSLLSRVGVMIIRNLFILISSVLTGSAYSITLIIKWSDICLTLISIVLSLIYDRKTYNTLLHLSDCLNFSVCKKNWFKSAQCPFNNCLFFIPYLLFVLLTASVAQW